MLTAQIRLGKERKQWRKYPVYGFIAKPMKNPDGTLNLMKWECAVPGKKGTPFENCLFTLNLVFSDHYPYMAPSCKFDPPLFHPNVYTCGTVCCSIFNLDWHEDVSIKQILLCLQDLLGKPNINSLANPEAAILYKNNIDAYNNRLQNLSQSTVKEIP